MLLLLLLMLLLQQHKQRHKQKTIQKQNNNTMADGSITMSDGNIIKSMECPIWERSSEEGQSFSGRIGFDSIQRRFNVYDDIKWPPSTHPHAFPALFLPLIGADIKLKPIKSRNNNHKMGKITVISSLATGAPSRIYANEVFTFILSLEDCNTIIGIFNSWPNSKSK
jgi:hypothetical protein